jgi:hypothetical protein
VDRLEQPERLALPEQPAQLVLKAKRDLRVSRASRGNKVRQERQALKALMVNHHLYILIELKKIL